LPLQKKTLGGKTKTKNEEGGHFQLCNSNDDVDQELQFFSLLIKRRKFF